MKNDEKRLLDRRLAIEKYQNVEVGNKILLHAVFIALILQVFTGFFACILIRIDSKYCPISSDYLSYVPYIRRNLYQGPSCWIKQVIFAYFCISAAINLIYFFINIVIYLKYFNFSFKGNKLLFVMLFFMIPDVFFSWIAGFDFRRTILSKVHEGQFFVPTMFACLQTLMLLFLLVTFFKHKAESELKPI